jgi:hypothetical protein
MAMRQVANAVRRTAMTGTPSRSHPKAWRFVTCAVALAASLGVLLINKDLADATATLLLLGLAAAAGSFIARRS